MEYLNINTATLGSGSGSQDGYHMTHWSTVPAAWIYRANCQLTSRRWGSDMRFDHSARDGVNLKHKVIISRISQTCAIIAKTF